MIDVFGPASMGGLRLANRFVRAATWAGLADDQGEPTPRLVNLVADLAQGGVGLIITGHAYVHPSGKHAPWQLGIDRDETIPAFRGLTEAVHEHGGKIALQLGYGGSYLSRSRVERMTLDDLAGLAAAYGLGAKRAFKAGFDAVQILAALGFFLSQMLCPRYNRRQDRYGGSLENRARMLLEVLKAIREAVGPDFPVLVKLNGQDYVEDGLTLPESVQVGVWLEELGADAIEISGGLLNVPSIYKGLAADDDGPVAFESEAAAFKKRVQLPLILGGRIRSIEQAERLASDGLADFIAMCRPFIREPDLIARWISGDRGRALCISCDNCFEEIKAGRGVSCVPLVRDAETFFAQAVEYISAGPLFPDGLQYEIAFGLEDWQGSYLPVVKVSLVSKDGRTRRAPSFSPGSDAHIRVMQCIEMLLKQQGLGAD
jgi:2,4-dienoyl-CoA reductase-like NADH-dependent reductase (Old Yellow Enzyme family)